MKATAEIYHTDAPSTISAMNCALFSVDVARQAKPDDTRPRDGRRQSLPFMSNGEERVRRILATGGAPPNVRRSLRPPVARLFPRGECSVGGRKPGPSRGQNLSSSKYRLRTADPSVSHPARSQLKKRDKVPAFDFHDGALHTQRIAQPVSWPGGNRSHRRATQDSREKLWCRSCTPDGSGRSDRGRLTA